MFSSPTKIKTLIIHLPVFATPLCPIISQAYPSAKQVFVAGKPLDSVQSLLEHYQGPDYDFGEWSKSIPVPNKPYVNGEQHLESVSNWLERDLRNGTERPLQVNVALIYAGVIATFLRHRDCFQGVWLAQDLVRNQEKTVSNVLETLGISATNDTSPVQPDVTNTECDLTMTPENWEQTRDIFFMLRIPFDVDIPDNDQAKERFTKILTSRHRKIGRYGPRGGYVTNKTPIFQR